jgi:ClpP class serine protease
MGFYGEYLNQPLASDFDLLAAERKRQLQAISDLRGGRDVLVFAADLNKESPLTSIGYVDILPINDQLANLKGPALDLILETPGGSGEVAEDIIRILRGKYLDLAVIVPGWAKSAGTIMAMAADEILMGPTSALGPIDAQLLWQGKRFSADALLEGFRKIKKEVEDSGVLNKAYIPMLQGISPGELQSAQNALDFATTLVTEWLAHYKFKNWTQHSSTGRLVTDEEKRNRANQIAAELCNHKNWLTHGRSIKLEDLQTMRLLVTDYTADAKLSEAINRYYALLHMAFSSNLYKLYETPTSQIYKFQMPIVPPPQLQRPPGTEIAELDLECCKCHSRFKIQANLGRTQPIKPGSIPFPPDNKLKCPRCGAEHDLSDARRQLQAQAKKPVI